MCNLWRYIYFTNAMFYETDELNVPWGGVDLKLSHKLYAALFDFLTSNHFQFLVSDAFASVGIVH